MRIFRLALLILLAACSKAEEPAPAKTRTAAEQRKIDSTLGASAIPGAGGVKQAMAVSDSAARRKAIQDSIANNP